jgi:hypothetical protein
VFINVRGDKLVIGLQLHIPPVTIQPQAKQKGHEPHDKTERHHPAEVFAGHVFLTVGSHSSPILFHNG